jgi:hypothetical protein
VQVVGSVVVETAGRQICQKTLVVEIPVTVTPNCAWPFNSTVTGDNVGPVTTTPTTAELLLHPAIQTARSATAPSTPSFRCPPIVPVLSARCLNSFSGVSPAAGLR